MPRRGPLYTAGSVRNASSDFKHITIGEVVDTDDPQQMGRIRVACPYFGDLQDSPIDEIPWATYVSPLAGTTTSPQRGRGEDKTAGQVAYGMFNIPKVGSSVLIACIDADPRFRIWLGCVHDQYFPHTLPHGRYSYKTANKPDGPFSSSEDKIQPLYDSQTAAFTNKETGVDPRMSFEFRTRAADTSVAGLGEDYVNTEDSAVSRLADDYEVEYEDNPAGDNYKNTQGYPNSRVEAGTVSNEDSEELVRDPQTYSWTTPGFHSISMQDNADNCRVRIRTTHGHQVIMDDTNERIYVSTAGGKTWIELDEVGNIDIYGERNISVHAKKDLNYSAGENFNISANNINLVAEEAVKVQSKGAGGITIKAEEDIFMSGTELNLTSDLDTLLTAGAALNFLATGNILNTGAEIHLNGPAADAATVGEDSTGVSRKPDHEPWARTMLVDGEPELPYDSPDVGRVENGQPLPRNPRWHR
jgi:hypothetical protein